MKRPVPGVRNRTRAPEGRLPFGVAGGGAAGEAPIFRIEAVAHQPPLGGRIYFPESRAGGGGFVRDQRVALVTDLSRARSRRG
jgi:hypothetical protein